MGNTLEKYKTGSIDFHSEIAEITGLERKAAKTISLGLFYGMGKAKLQAQLGINDEMEAKRILSEYDVLLTRMILNGERRERAS